MCLPVGLPPHARKCRCTQRLVNQLVCGRAQRGRREIGETVGVIGEHILELGRDVDAPVELVDRVVRDRGADRRIRQHRRARADIDVRVEHLTLDPHRQNRCERSDRRRDHEREHSCPTQTARSSGDRARGRCRIRPRDHETPGCRGAPATPADRLASTNTNWDLTGTSPRQPACMWPLGHR